MKYVIQWDIDYSLIPLPIIAPASARSCFSSGNQVVLVMIEADTALLTAIIIAM